MKTQVKIFPFKHLIVLDADGTMDLAASKAALQLLVTNPGFESSREVLLDLRGVECELSTADIFDVAVFMSHTIAAHHVSPRIAVLVAEHQHGQLAFNKAQFLELCADNRGLNVRAFEDYKEADGWLSSHQADEPRCVTTLPGILSVFPDVAAKIAVA